MQDYKTWEWTGDLPAEWMAEDMSVVINAQTLESQRERLRGFLELKQVYSGAISQITTKLETLDGEFRVRYAHNPIHHIDSRLKSPQSILEKLRRKGHESSVQAAREHLLDIAGVRVVCNYIDDIYDLATMLECQDDVTVVCRRDYIAQPKENGYRSLHLIVRVPVYLSDRIEQVPVEVQIRTLAMDFWASLEHEIRYKSTETVDDSIRTRIKHCAETSALLDREMQSIRNACLREQATRADA